LGFAEPYIDVAVGGNDFRKLPKTLAMKMVTAVFTDMMETLQRTARCIPETPIAKTQGEKLRSFYLDKLSNAGCCEHSNEHLGFMTDEDFLLIIV
jgi:hypothetical protein